MTKAPIRYRLTYEAYPGHIVEWEKTADELLVPNGTEPLLAWMLRESDSRGSRIFNLEVINDDLGPRLADVALVVTDQTLGKGTYAEVNRLNPHPSIQDAIARWRQLPEEEKPDVADPTE